MVLIAFVDTYSPLLHLDSHTKHAFSWCALLAITCTVHAGRLLDELVRLAFQITLRFVEVLSLNARNTGCLGWALIARGLAKYTLRFNAVRVVSRRTRLPTGVDLQIGVLNAGRAFIGRLSAGLARSLTSNALLVPGVQVQVGGAGADTLIVLKKVILHAGQAKQSWSATLTLAWTYLTGRLLLVLAKHTGLNAGGLVQQIVGSAAQTMTYSGLTGWTVACALHTFSE